MLYLLRNLLFRGFYQGIHLHGCIIIFQSVGNTCLDRLFRCRDFGFNLLRGRIVLKDFLGCPVGDGDRLLCGCCRLLFLNLCECLSRIGNLNRVLFRRFRIFCDFDNMPAFVSISLIPSTHSVRSPPQPCKISPSLSGMRRRSSAVIVLIFKKSPPIVFVKIYVLSAT